MKLGLMTARIQGRVGAALMCAGLLAVATASTVSRSTVSYEAPDVTLVRADGKPVSLPRELDDGRYAIWHWRWQPLPWHV